MRTYRLRVGLAAALVSPLAGLSGGGSVAVAKVPLRFTVPQQINVAIGSTATVDMTFPGGVPDDVDFGRTGPLQGLPHGVWSQPMCGLRPKVCELTVSTTPLARPAVVRATLVVTLGKQVKRTPVSVVITGTTAPFAAPSASEKDPDADLIPNVGPFEVDNCPTIANRTQVDQDNDDLGDDCDPDPHGDTPLKISCGATGPVKANISTGRAPWRTYDPVSLTWVDAATASRRTPRVPPGVRYLQRPAARTHLVVTFEGCADRWLSFGGVLHNTAGATSLFLDRPNWGVASMIHSIPALVTCDIKGSKYECPSKGGPFAWSSDPTTLYPFRCEGVHELWTSAEGDYAIEATVTCD